MKRRSDGERTNRESGSRIGRFTVPAPSSPAGIVLIVSVITLTVVLSVAAAIYQMKNDGACLLLSLSGVPCPSCGMTRATFCALRGDLKGAFYYHPLFFVPYLMCALGVLAIPLKKFRKQILVAILLLGASLVICWVIRAVTGGLDVLRYS